MTQSAGKASEAAGNHESSLSHRDGRNLPTAVEFASLRPLSPGPSRSLPRPGSHGHDPGEGPATRGYVTAVTVSGQSATVHHDQVAIATRRRLSDDRDGLSPSHGLAAQSEGRGPDS